MKYIAALFILILPLACSNESKDSEFLGVMNSSAVDDETSFLEIPSEEPLVQKIEQKLIKEAYLHFETKDLDETYNHIISVTKKYNGYIQDELEDKAYGNRTQSLTVRVPTTYFENSIDAISEAVDFFDTKRITSKDVTEEFIDLEARLKAKNELEKRYLQLLDEAKNVNEILEIERELSKIREEIEAKQGRLKYLQNRVSLSTLNIKFYKITTETGVTKSYGSKMWSAIVGGMDGLSIFFLGILYIWPFILVIIIAFFIIKKWLSKRNKK